MRTRADEIADELLAMMATDQRMRRAALTDRSAWDPGVDRQQTSRLREIVDEIGWPSIQRIGAEAAHAAWLVVQHADEDRAFQKRCLALMRALPPGAVSPRNIAYLEDRVLVGEGRPQRYGTQLRRGDDRAYEPVPIDDPDRVDERRAAVGLEPLAEYLAQARIRLG